MSGSDCLDHAERMARARRSLDGLSVGDAFGECFFGDPATVRARIQDRACPSGQWGYTDDTVMAMSIVDVLDRHQCINQEALAALFALRYRLDPARGYGRGAHEVLSGLARGARWHTLSHGVFGGSGSMGNGGAMRAAPIGAYHWDDFGLAAEGGRLSAEVTHAHPEGQAGAVAVAVAAAWFARGGTDPAELFETVLQHLSDGETRAGVARAAQLAPDGDACSAAAVLGNGSRVVSQDTVPFCLWVIAQHAESFEDALWLTVSGLGDRDTTCAIVGGVLGARPESRIPEAWLEAREPLAHMRLR